MAIGTDTGSILTGNPVSDAYGNKTETAGTVITRVIAPRANYRTKVTGFIYTAGTPAHTLTFMTCFQEVKVSADAAASQAVVSLDVLPTTEDGTGLAANDFLVLQYETGLWAAHKVSSLSALDVTVTANFSKKIKFGSRAFFMGAPGDHPDRAFKILASEKLEIYGGDLRCVVAVSTKNDQPILAHSDNATVAGNFQWLAYIYADA